MSSTDSTDSSYSTDSTDSIRFKEYSWDDIPSFIFSNSITKEMCEYINEYMPDIDWDKIKEVHYDTLEYKRKIIIRKSMKRVLGCVVFVYSINR